MTDRSNFPDYVNEVRRVEAVRSGQANLSQDTGLVHLTLDQDHWPDPESRLTQG